MVQPRALLVVCISLALAYWNSVARAQTTPDQESTFTIQRQQEAEGCAPGQPSDQTFNLAVVRVDGDGRLADPSQLTKAMDCIAGARSTHPEGVIVVMFIHGWRHDAQWADEHFAEFRRVLTSLSLREAERFFDGRYRGKRVIGVYLAWPGSGGLTTFPARYKTARKIARSPAVAAAIQQLVQSTKSTTPALRESQFLAVGHSMGALILETALQSLIGNAAPATPQEPESCAVVKRGVTPILFPDLILLLNSAADSSVATQTRRIVRQSDLRRTIRCGRKPYEAPLIISMTAEDDRATSVAFPVARGARRAEGHDPALHTHRLLLEGEGAVCSPRPSDSIQNDFNQSWHCVRHPLVANDVLTSFVIDLPQPDHPRETCHMRLRLEPIPSHTFRGFWIFHLPSEVVGAHSDIFNARSNLFTLAMMQAAGAVVSLARDWRDIFEPEEGRCQLR